MLKKSYLIEIFPELDLIKDTELRRKVISVFLKAAHIGGWDSLDGIPFTLKIETSVSFVVHTRAVTKMALQCAQVMKSFVPIDLDYLVAGALLHDVGKLLEFEKKHGKVILSKQGHMLRHPVSGTLIANEIGLPQEILHIIVAHSKEGESVKRIPEAIIINHCDFIQFENLKEKYEEGL